MGFLSQKLERSQLVAGDHIYTWRTAFTYSHHGIYIGEGTVVHFGGGFGPFPLCSSSNLVPPQPQVCPNLQSCGFRFPESGVVLSCLDCFLANGSLYRFEYDVPTYHLLLKLRGGTCTTAMSDPPEQVIQRTMYLLLNGFGVYHVTHNNCENFALYCKTGLMCIEGSVGQASVPQAMVAAGACKLLGWLIPGATAVTTATTIGTYFYSRHSGDLGVRVDAKKVLPEDLASFHASVKFDGTPIAVGQTAAHDDPIATRGSGSREMGISQLSEMDWALCQSLDKVYITVLMPGARIVKGNLTPDGGFALFSSADAENWLCELKLDLCDKVNVEESKMNAGVGRIYCILVKVEEKWWKNLVHGDDKAETFVKF